MYPNITLQIKDFRPAIIFNPDEGLTRQMTLAEENILEVIEELARELDLIDELLEKIEDHEVRLTNLLEIARKADETKHDQFPEINTQSVEFELKDVIKKFLEEGKTQLVDYTALDGVEGDVLKELHRNQNADFFASLLDAIYNILIAKALLAASEIGVEKIRLVDEHKNARLQEKMARELEKFGLELVVE